MSEINELVDADIITDWVRASMPEGATQIEIFTSIVDSEDLTESEIGSVMQVTSRLLSNMAKNGVLDDSGRQGQKHIYKIPDKKLSTRGTRTEQLQAENERLRERIKQLEDARDCVVQQNQRLREELATYKAVGQI